MSYLGWLQLIGQTGHFILDTWFLLSDLDEISSEASSGISYLNETIASAIRNVHVT